MTATLTLIEAAAQAGVDPATLRQAIKQERLQATKRGRDWFIEPEEVNRYIAERRPWHRPHEPVVFEPE